jgi:hypothetical protein
MDTLLETLQKENFELRKKIETHDDQLDGLRGVLYQLIGGVFNQKTQRCVMNSFIDELFGTTSSEGATETEGIEEEMRWPTTRQGDNNELRLRKLEETVQKLEKQIENMEKRQEHVVKM